MTFGAFVDLHLTKGFLAVKLVSVCGCVFDHLAKEWQCESGSEPSRSTFLFEERAARKGGRRQGVVDDKLRRGAEGRDVEGGRAIFRRFPCWPTCVPLVTSDDSRDRSCRTVRDCFEFWCPHPLASLYGSQFSEAVKNLKRWPRSKTESRRIIPSLGVFPCLAGSGKGKGPALHF
mmetsp:Transcript_10841/g.20653  ORF Transcript_10841/g.20653 Transcript_10841/m.20653 type:complete len:175 (+) Transcript_10841:137-661(+)